MEDIGKYFLESKTMVLPRLGKLELKPVEAKSSVTENLIRAPRWEIFFKEDTAIKVPEKQIQYLSAKSGLNAEQVMHTLEQIAGDLKAGLEAGNVFTLHDVGNFQMVNGKVVAEPGSQLRPVFKDITAKKIIRPNSEHTLLVGEKERTASEMRVDLLQKKSPLNIWLIVCLVCAVLAIALLSWYFLS